MELDEAIKHCRDKAEELKKDADYYDVPYGMDTSARTDCLECAKEHEQLAEWLEELKAFRKAHEIIGSLPIGTGALVLWDIINDCLKEAKK